MLSNYFKIGFRNLLKHKFFSFTNIAGLTLGILCCLLILMYVSYELSYDRWNPHAERIVRPVGDINFGGAVMKFAVASSVLAPDAGATMPEIENWCRFRDYGSYLVRENGTDKLNTLVESALTVDSTFFSLFPSKILSGDPGRILREPNSLMISNELAIKLFGSIENSGGKILLLNNRNIWKVSGVFEDIPANTHFKAQMLLAMNGNEEEATAPPFWAASNNFHTYLLLKPGVRFEDFKEKFEKLSRERVAITSSTLLGIPLEELEKTGQYARYPLQRLTDIHLKSDLAAELQPNGDIKYIWIFSAIAFFVLIIACINFMNLTTAKATQRTREIAVRKVMGGKKEQLIYQFLSEAILMAGLSVILAIIISLFLKPWYNELTGNKLSLPWTDPLFWTVILLGTIIVGLLAGSYPAFYLSAFQPVKIFRNAVQGAAKGDRLLRHGLVIFQFVIATCLIIGSFLIYQQLHFMQNKKLGFKKDQILVVDDTYTISQKIESFKEQIQQNAGVNSVTISSYLPIPSSRSDNTFSKARELREDLAINMQQWIMDYDYAKTYDLNILEGRFFDKSFGSDSSAVVINETALKILGFENPIGQKIYGMENTPEGTPKPEDFREYTIIGVVENFHFESLRENIRAQGLFLGRSTGNVSVSFEAGKTAEIISSIESIWNKMAPNQPFAYRFVDEAFGRLYRNEQRVGKIMIVFTILAVFVSCLGLLGLSTYVAEQKTKEIGVRKVLGARVLNIVSLISGKFILLVISGILIAIPLTWYMMHQWLENFAYRIEIHWSVFIFASLIALIVAILTVGIQSVRAALVNPIKSLRSE